MYVLTSLNTSTTNYTKDPQRASIHFANQTRIVEKILSITEIVLNSLHKLTTNYTKDPQRASIIHFANEALITEKSPSLTVPHSTHFAKKPIIIEKTHRGPQFSLQTNHLLYKNS